LGNFTFSRRCDAFCIVERRKQSTVKL
jgi:hypothetical protein